MRAAAFLMSRLGFAVAIAILVSTAYAAQASTPTPASADPERAPLMLADEEYWGNFERTRGAVVADIAKSDFQGILIGAPKKVSVGGRENLPVVGYWVRSLRDDRVLSQERQMVVVATSQQTGRVFAGLALQNGKEPVAKAAPPGDPGEGTTLNIFTFDLRRTLGLPWESGSYRVTVLLGRFISNSVTVELEGGSAASAAAVANPPVRIPSTGPDRSFPEDIPAKPGIELLRKRGSGCQVASRFLFASPPHNPGVPARIALLLTGSRMAGPWTVTLEVPTVSKGKEYLGGHFTFDLTRSPEMPKIPQEYFVYAFAARGAAGPVQCQAGK
jgi:hypothetical protein